MEQKAAQVDWPPAANHARGMKNPRSEAAGLA